MVCMDRVGVGRFRGAEEGLRLMELVALKVMRG